MKPVLVLGLILGLVLGGASQAEAHAFLDRADPRVGSTVKSPPSMVKIWFTEELEPAFSKIRVIDSRAAEVDGHDSKIDPTDRKLMTVSLPKLAPGRYEVSWTAVATDTHHTQGSFSFEVSGP